MKIQIEKQKAALTQRRQQLAKWEEALKVPEKTRTASIIAIMGSKADGSDKSIKRKITIAKSDIANLEAKLA